MFIRTDGLKVAIESRGIALQHLLGDLPEGQHQSDHYDKGGKNKISSRLSRIGWVRLDIQDKSLALTGETSAKKPVP